MAEAVEIKGLTRLRAPMAAAIHEQNAFFSKALSYVRPFLAVNKYENVNKTKILTTHTTTVLFD